MEDYQTEKAERIRALRVKAHAIAAALPAGWIVDESREPSDWSVSLIHPHGEGLWLNTSHVKGRLSISGHFGALVQPFRPSNPADNTITASLTRDGAAIAREIERRLLPLYVPALAEATKRWADACASTDEAKQTARKIAHHFGPTSAAYLDAHLDYYKDRSSREPFRVWAGPIEVEISRTGGATFKVNASDNVQALRIAAALSQFIDKEA